MAKIFLIFGGPSNERSISLDSARSFYDAARFSFPPDTIQLLFVDRNCDIYPLDPKWIYCNTIEDFETALPTTVTDRLNVSSWAAEVRANAIVCLLIHGKFGEDGALTRRFEDAGIAAVLGSASDVLALCIDKTRTLDELRKLGVSTPRGLKVQKHSASNGQALDSLLVSAFGEKLPDAFIVKPNDCGSSDGVSICDRATLREGISNAARFSDEIRIEEVIEGQEFSVIVFESGGVHLPLIPTGITFARSSESVYSRQKKYMPGSGAFHEIPINASISKTEEIQKQACHITQSLGIRDWCRLDGFLNKTGEITWLEVNPVPGCGQDSFLFQQAAAVGIQPSRLCTALLMQVARRAGIQLEQLPDSNHGKSRSVAVVGGGASSERHVSRMSWLNVSRKLADSKRYDIQHIFLRPNGEYIKVPSFFALQHTVDEVEALIDDQERQSRIRLLARNLKRKFPAQSKLFGLQEIPAPKRLNLVQLRRTCDFIFLALHGGIGEDGTLQSELEKLGMPFNGSNSQVSRLCMDKINAARVIHNARIEGVSVPKQVLFDLESVARQCAQMGRDASEFLNKAKALDWFSTSEAVLKSDFLPFSEAVIKVWNELQKSHGIKGPVVAKPKADGCSSGVAVFMEPETWLPLYALSLFSGVPELPLRAFFPDAEPEKLLRFPAVPQTEFLIEDYIGPKSNQELGRFIEITAGVVEWNGKLRCLAPSEVRNDCGILTVDEKFNKGVGVNLTPPPGISGERLQSIMSRIEKIAGSLGIQHYARIDAIVDNVANIIYFLECNTLPGLTAATVLYTQALQTDWLKMPPFEFLDHLIRERLDNSRPPVARDSSLPPSTKSIELAVNP